ncbi:BQ5605_C037g11577 [Microbotryum silenes-dioicae]|uniref:BQ5605_C037g11577 protein n=1 Tax=Microbotryum silenes-dioicae TaxID=796604 RepID=A0A2X0N8M7_9BASI|nr:BQ5605_C037g11577 [Microbotryum silenes-dioicae]
MHLGLNVHQPQRDHAVFPARRPRTDPNAASTRTGEATEHRLSSLVAALIGPFIVLFSIPGLTEYWYTQKGSTEERDWSQPDPNLIVISGTITLVLGIIANILLALRLVETHARFCIFSGLFILSWFTFINTIALILFTVKSSKVDDGYTLSTAFSLTAASTALAALVLVMFLLEGFQTKWYRQGGTGLSGKQRSLVVAFGVFMGTICVGSVMTKYLNNFSSFLDSIYFIIQTITTTGFGDLVPKTTASRIFSIFYDTWGILSFAVVVAFVRSTALEAMQTQYKKREKIILQRIQGQRLERIRTGDSRQVEAPRTSWPRRFLNRFAFYSTPTPRPRIEAQGVGEEQDLDAQRIEMMDPRLLNGNIIADAGGLLHEDDYEKTILEMKRERAREHRSELVVSLLIYLTTWVVGAAVFSRLENWDYFISFYFVFMTFTTIGHGDYAPRTQAGRAFFSAWALVGAGVTTVFFSILADSYSSRFNGLATRNWFKRTLLRFHNNPKARAALEEEERRFGIRPSVNVDDAPSGSVSTASPAPKPTSEGEEDIVEGNSNDVEDPAPLQTARLLELVKETREHVDDLIHYDGMSSTGECGMGIDREVKQLMDEQKFSMPTRLEVMSDERMKRSLYLRRMLAKLVELEKIVHVAVEDYETTRAGAEVNEIYIGELGTHILNSPLAATGGPPFRTDTNESYK